jgi:hypothetical protein
MVVNDENYPEKNLDAEEDIYELAEIEGIPLASHEWDSGDCGAGAGETILMEIRGRLYLFHDAGFTKFETAVEAWKEITKVTYATVYLSISSEFRKRIQNERFSKENHFENSR